MFSGSHFSGEELRRNGSRSDGLKVSYSHEAALHENEETKTIAIYGSARSAIAKG